MTTPRVSCIRRPRWATGQTIRDLLERLFNQRDRRAIDELFAPDLRDAVATHYDELRTGFSDLGVRIDELVVDRDMAAARLTLTGTHDGRFAGVPATGTQMAWGSMRFYRVTTGRVVATWAIQDRLGLFQQLGLVPADIGGVSWAAAPPSQE